jgi:hypothetical protein
MKTTKKVVDLATEMSYLIDLTAGADSVGNCVRGFDALVNKQEGPVDGPFSAIHTLCRSESPKPVHWKARAS